MQSARTSRERRRLVPDTRRADYQLVILSAIVARAPDPLRADRPPFQCAGQRASCHCAATAQVRACHIRPLQASDRPAAPNSCDARRHAAKPPVLGLVLAPPQPFDPGGGCVGGGGPASHTRRLRHSDGRWRLRKSCSSPYRRVRTHVLLYLYAWSILLRRTDLHRRMSAPFAHLRAT